MRAKVKVLSTDTPKYARFEEQVFETTVGRLLFNSALPSHHSFINDHVSQWVPLLDGCAGSSVRWQRVVEFHVYE